MPITSGAMDTSSNRSVVWVAPKTLEIQHREVGDISEEEVLVEVISTGICGSDAHVWASSPAKQPPVLGHESAGRIIKVGAKVLDRAVGQRVAIEPGFACMKWVGFYFISERFMLNYIGANSVSVANLTSVRSWLIVVTLRMAL